MEGRIRQSTTGKETFSRLQHYTRSVPRQIRNSCQVDKSLLSSRFHMIASNYTRSSSQSYPSDQVVCHRPGQSGGSGQSHGNQAWRGLGMFVCWCPWGRRKSLWPFWSFRRFQRPRLDPSRIFRVSVRVHIQEDSGKSSWKVNVTWLFCLSNGKCPGATKHLKRYPCFSGRNIPNGNSCQ